MYSLIAELSAHDLEVAETLIGVIRFLLIFLAARALAEVLVRLSLPTIVGKLSLTNTSANALAAKNINRNLITPINVSATSKSCALNSASKEYI